MTKRIAPKPDLSKQAAEYALKEALKSDKKLQDKDNKIRFKHAYETFFESYDAFMKQG